MDESLFCTSGLCLLIRRKGNLRGLSQQRQVGACVLLSVQATDVLFWYARLLVFSIDFIVHDVLSFL